MSALKPAGRIAAVAIVLAAAGQAAAQCNCGYPEPCTITTNIANFTSGVERTVCTVRTSSGYGSLAYTLTTPRGEQYRIENPITIFDGWYINGSPGVRVATTDPARPCYRTPAVEICLGR
jgi:hypothetical protein